VTTQTTGTNVIAGKPSVNLLPPEIAEAAKFRRFQLAMAGLLVLAVAAVGVMYENAHHSVQQAENAKSAAVAEAAGLQGQVAQLQSVKSTYDQVANYKSLQSEALGSEIRWSFYLADLSLRMPNSVWLTGMTVTQGAPETATSSTGAPDSGTTPAVIAPPDQVATISFTGVALSHDDVAKWLNAMAGEKGWSDPYATNITESTIGTQVVDDFTASVAVTSQALSNRFTQPES